jgi:DNA-binding response OmpR family regulator
MRKEQLCKADGIVATDFTTILQQAAHYEWPINEDHQPHPTSYRLAVGQDPIELGVVEFRILLFLAGRPYHAFTRRCIADAVSSARNPVAEDTVDRHVASLLDQLGAFHDHVQSVPYIGYRFKA